MALFLGDYDNEWAETPSSEDEESPWDEDEEPWTWTPPSSPLIVIPESPEQQQQPDTQNVEPTEQQHQLENAELAQQRPQLESNPDRGRRAEPCACAGCGRVREGVMATPPNTTTTDPQSPNTRGGRGRGRLSELITLARQGRLTQPNINRFFRPRSSRGRGVGRGLPRRLELEDTAEAADEERSRGSSNPGHGEGERLSERTPPPPPPGWLSARRGRPRVHVSPQPRGGDTRRGVEEPPVPDPQPIPVEQAGEVRPVNSQNYISLEDRQALVGRTEARLQADPPLQWFLIPAAVGALPLTPAPGSTPPPPAAPATPTAATPTPASASPANPPSPESGAVFLTFYST
ncbi:mediator of DNA damage checkpoint protein 1-like [Liolophura sinensis]|uniref:mediator of DNA damage checkpoint protein 1-like n=1 Tax=Liolophura sinensis TaxID=3198878 RepID=UPI003157F88B